MGCARRRLDVRASGAWDIRGALRVPPIGRSRRGFFILLFTPRTEKTAPSPTTSPRHLSRTRGVRILRPVCAGSPYVLVGAGEDTLVLGSVEVARVFTRQEEKCRVGYSPVCTCVYVCLVFWDPYVSTNAGLRPFSSVIFAANRIQCPLRPLCVCVCVRICACTCTGVWVEYSV